MRGTLLVDLLLTFHCSVYAAVRNSCHRTWSKMKLIFLCSRTAPQVTPLSEYLVCRCWNFICYFKLINWQFSHRTLLAGPPLGTITSNGVDNGTSLGMHSVGSPFLEAAFHQGISSSVPSSLPSLMRVGSVGNYSGIPDSGYTKGQLAFDIRPAAGIYPHSLPEHHDGLANGIPCNSSNIIGANFNQIPPERVDHRQLCRVGSEGHSLGLNEGGKYVSQECCVCSHYQSCMQLVSIEFVSCK